MVRTRPGDRPFTIGRLIGGLHDAWRQFKVKRGVIDKKAGQILHHVSLHHRADAGIGGVQSFAGTGGHFDGGFGVTQFQANVAGLFVIDTQNDAVETERAESFASEGKRIVVARRNVVKRIDAGFIRFGGDRKAGSGIGQGHVDADHHRALLIGDGAGQAGIRLRVQAGAAQEQQGRKQKYESARGSLKLFPHRISPHWFFSNHHTKEFFAGFDPRIRCPMRCNMWANSSQLWRRNGAQFRGEGGR